MGVKVEKVVFKGTVNTREGVKNLLLNPGDFVVVERGVPRLMILLCPCGCGDELLLNLDKRSGPAWKLYLKKGLYTLSPSYWRESACCSHFVIWSSRVYWCSNDSDFSYFWSLDEKFEKDILQMLNDKDFYYYLDIAEALNINPWECLQGCIQMSKRGLLVSNGTGYKEFFKRAT